jgi:4-hydroxybenzoate polyprenyltransferase
MGEKMVAWILIIIALTIFQIVSVSYSFPEDYIYISTILMIVAALGMLYRVYLKKKKGLREKEEKEIEELKERLTEKEREHSCQQQANGG